MTPDEFRALAATVRMQGWPISSAVHDALTDAANRIEINESALREVITKWRETADIWEQHNHDYRMVPKRMGIEPAPRRGVSQIQNWINWLRNCATSIEDVLK